MNSNDFLTKRPQLLTQDQQLRVASSKAVIGWQPRVILQVGWRWFSNQSKSSLLLSKTEKKNKSSRDSSELATLIFLAIMDLMPKLGTSQNCMPLNSGLMKNSTRVKIMFIWTSEISSSGRIKAPSKTVFWSHYPNSKSKSVKCRSSFQPTRINS